jgi:uncharacterized protein (DUF2147 family)
MLSYISKMKILFTLCCLLAALASNAQADKILGTWLTESGTAKVEIGIGSGFYYGKIVWLLDPTDKNTGQPRTDIHNPGGGLALGFFALSTLQ